MDWTFLSDYKWLIGSVALPIFIFILGVLFTLALQFLSNLKYGKKYFRIIWRKACRLKPDDFLRGRSYYDFYLKRAEDERIQELVKNKKNFLIVGSPLSGKTRATYEAIKKHKLWRDVLIAVPENIERENFKIPKHFKFWRKRIIFIDDLHLFVEKNNFEHLLYSALKKGITIVSTCRSGEDYEKVKGNMADVNLYLESIFGENIVELGIIGNEEGEKISKEVGIDWETVDFDGTIGSIFMQLTEMKNRFDNRCTSEERAILRVIKDMYDCGVFEEDLVFPIEWIRKVAEKDGIKKHEYEWKELFENLLRWEFLLTNGEYVKVEEVYLDKVVSHSTPIDTFSRMEIMIDTLNDVPYALVNLGNRAHNLGLYMIEKPELMKVAINAYERALEKFDFQKSPNDYAMTKNNLGATYSTLAEVKDKGKNCRRAIGAFNEALRIYTFGRFPIYYATTQNNLGNAYWTLADMEDKGGNCRRAIGAYQEALKVRTLERFPMDYATTQNNLGTAYRKLAEVEKGGDNCRRAIGACQEALKVYTIERFPMQYAGTQNNLGNAYRKLGDVENNGENYRHAMGAYLEALHFRTIERFPILYAATQNNLGTAYGSLASVDENGKNCHLAIEAFEKALEVYTIERFPMQYADIQNNLGNTFYILAGVEDKRENCSKALKAYKKAIDINKRGKIYDAIKGVEENIALLEEFCKDIIENSK